MTYGNRNQRRTLTPEDIRLIRALEMERIYHAKKASELQRKNIAEKFGTHVRNIEKILSYETWSHVE